MKSSNTLQMAKQLEEASVQQAVLDVYRKYRSEAPGELCTDLSLYVKKLRQKLYPNKLKNRILDEEKALGFDRSETGQYCNMDLFPIVKSQELSLSSKTDSSACLGIYPNCDSLLQDLCLALFAGADVMPALRMAVRDLPVATSIEELLTTLRKEAKKKISASFFDRLRFMVSAFLSTRLGTLCFGKICPFDPRCFAKNIGGRFMEEHIFREKGPATTISWLVGATPTVGDHLSEEALSAISALSNQDSVFPYGLWVYCNLQGTKLSCEKNRSRALLEASMDHIDHFRVASLSVDNPGYLRGGKLSLQRQFIEDELQRAVAGKASWFAFALKDNEQHEWSLRMQYTVARAFVMAEARAHENSKVFHELVILGLIRSWQGFCVQKATKNVISTIACKECADRGGSVNAAFMWALFEGGEEDRIKNVEAILWGRPLLARSRLNEHVRTRGFAALVRAFSPNDVRKFLVDVYEGQ